MPTYLYVVDLPEPWRGSYFNVNMLGDVETFSWAKSAYPYDNFSPAWGGDAGEAVKNGTSGTITGGTLAHIVAHDGTNPIIVPTYPYGTPFVPDANLAANATGTGRRAKCEAVSCVINTGILEALHRWPIFPIINCGNPYWDVAAKAYGLVYSLGSAVRTEWLAKPSAEKWGTQTDGRYLIYRKPDGTYTSTSAKGLVAVGFSAAPAKSGEIIGLVTLFEYSRTISQVGNGSPGPNSGFISPAYLCADGLYRYYNYSQYQVFAGVFAFTNLATPNVAEPGDAFAVQFHWTDEQLASILHPCALRRGWSGQIDSPRPIMRGQHILEIVDGGGELDATGIEAWEVPTRTFLAEQYQALATYTVQGSAFQLDSTPLLFPTCYPFENRNSGTAGNFATFLGDTTDVVVVDGIPVRQSPPQLTVTANQLLPPHVPSQIAVGVGWRNTGDARWPMVDVHALKDGGSIIYPYWPSLLTQSGSGESDPWVCGIDGAGSAPDASAYTGSDEDTYAAQISLRAYQGNSDYTFYVSYYYEPYVSGFKRIEFRLCRYEPNGAQYWRKVSYGSWSTMSNVSGYLYKKTVAMADLPPECVPNSTRSWGYQVRIIVDDGAGGELVDYLSGSDNYWSRENIQQFAPYPYDVPRDGSGDAFLGIRGAVPSQCIAKPSPTFAKISDSLALTATDLTNRVRLDLAGSLSIQCVNDGEWANYTDPFGSGLDLIPTYVVSDDKGFCLYGGPWTDVGSPFETSLSSPTSVTFYKKPDATFYYLTVRYRCTLMDLVNACQYSQSHTTSSFLFHKKWRIDAQTLGIAKIFDDTDRTDWNA